MNNPIYLLSKNNATAVKEYNEKGEKIVSPPMIEVENIKGALLGQVHTHNLVQTNLAPLRKTKSQPLIWVYIFMS